MKKLLTILSLTALAAGAVTIDSTSRIVLPDTPNIQEEYAAKELSKYLGKVLGGEIATVLPLRQYVLTTLRGEGVIWRRGLFPRVLRVWCARSGGG